MKITYVWMVYKLRIVFVLLALVFVAALIMLFLYMQSSTDEVQLLVSDNPKDFTSPDSYQTQNGKDEFVAVDIVKASEGMSHEELGYQRVLLSNGNIGGVFLRGSYKGSEPFENIYIDNQTPRMIIDYRFKPNDGIAQVYLFYLEGKVNDTVYMYVDQDWIDQMSSTQYVIWSEDISDHDSIKEELVDFVAIDNGLYVYEVEDDFSWMFTQRPIRGKLFFGDMSRQQFIDISEVNDVTYTTVMMI